jgi:hypothetical protein
MVLPCVAAASPACRVTLAVAKDSNGYGLHGARLRGARDTGRAPVATRRNYHLIYHIAVVKGAITGSYFKIVWALSGEWVAQAVHDWHYHPIYHSTSVPDRPDRIYSSAAGR